MSESYCVRLEKEYHVFSAAHFITFNGDVCERIHGHNYRVFAEVDGPLDENHYVVDFIAMRDELRAIVDGLDHYVILPTQHPMIHVTANDTEVEARFRERRWVFPRGDCVLLPVENTTAELVARYIALELLNRLERRCGFRPNVCRVGVDENHGQWAIYETNVN
ncbi:MAG: 6-pyruvoyl tetrahydropterin synthase family protein [Planctomycetales bacterium]|nr:6-pyruvoyl tetrahydropterin synthase family protein [Planctomycetales bacterium]